MIKTVDEAIKVLNKCEKGIPFEAIRYLRNQSPSEKILNEIIFAFKHAYDSKHYYDPLTDYWSSTPLWYAIVAEQHLSEKLIKPVIHLFTSTDKDWDLLDDQGEYLIGQLAEKYPNQMMEEVTKTIDKLTAKEISRYPYLYLFDVFYFADINKYKSWFLDTLKNKNLYWIEMFATTLADLDIKESIPIIKEHLAKEENLLCTADLEEALEQLETGIIKHPNLAKPYFQQRCDWEQYYKNWEKYFLDNQDVPENKSKEINAPRLIEKSSSQIHRLLEGKNFKSIDEANKYLNKVIKSGKIPKVQPKNELEVAQDIMYKAWEIEDTLDRICLATEALKVSPACADAYVLLAEEANTLEIAIENYKKGVEAGELAIGKEAFKQDVGHFWGILETRPYMRALLGLAQCLEELGKYDEAIAHYRELLRLNPGDNQGVRYILASCLSKLQRYDELEKHLMTSEYKNDWTPDWLYTKALLFFVKGGPSKKANKQLSIAVKDNPFVPEYLAGKKAIPKISPRTITVGGKDEAISYTVEFFSAWQKVPGAIDWLKEQTGIKTYPKVGRNDPCPCGSGKKYKKCCLKVHN